MDLGTLRLAQAVFLGFYTVLTVANAQLDRGSRGVRWFPLYSICVFVGAVLAAMGGDSPGPLSIISSDVAVSLGYVFLYRSLAEFFGQRSRRLALQAGCVFLVLLGGLEYGLIAPDQKQRLMVLSLILTAQLVLAASLAFHSARGAVRVSSAWMGVVLTMLSLSMFSSFLGSVAIGPLAHYLNTQTILEWTLLDNAVLQGAVTVAFVWMTAAALRHDLVTEASTDSLTRLLNRRAIMTAAEREIVQARHSGTETTGILVDLDRFKTLNDLLGHQGGDAAIVAVARRLEQGMRPGDLLARLGGDEFIVVLPRTSLEEAMELAEELRASFESAPVVFNGAEIAVTGSFGVAAVQMPDGGWKELITSCDKAMYDAKNKGGNAVGVVVERVASVV